MVGALTTALLLPPLTLNITQAATESTAQQEADQTERDNTSKEDASTTKKEKNTEDRAKEEPQKEKKDEPTQEDASSSQKEDDSKSDEEKDHASASQFDTPSYQYDLFAPFKLPSSTSRSSLLDRLFAPSESDTSNAPQSDESTEGSNENEEMEDASETNASSTETPLTEHSTLPKENTEENSLEDSTSSSYNPSTPDDRNFLDNLNALLNEYKDNTNREDTTNSTDDAMNTDEQDNTQPTTEDPSSENNTTSEMPSEEASTEASNSQENTNNDFEETEPDNDSANDQTDTSTSEEHTNDSASSSEGETSIDALLDQYSESARQTHNDYLKQNKDENDEANVSDTPEVDSDETTSSNPQIPDSSTLTRSEAQAPKQSFSTDNAQSNALRQTTLFQESPSTDSNDQSELHAVPNQSTREFINSIAEDAHDIGQQNDIYASIMIAQAILESDSGRSALSQAPNYNLFGMKGAYEGQSTDFDTLESDGRNMFQINASFRKYPDTKASLNDYARLIKNGIDGDPDIYKGTWKSESLSYRSAASALVGTYATDPSYDKKLKSLIETYDLDRFDDKEMPELLTEEDDSSVTTEDTGDFKPFSVSGDSPYPFGQCTWYVYHRMKQFDLTIAGDMGDAKDWTRSALEKGYSVSNEPSEHTAAVFEPGESGADPYYGHVAFVEKVNDDGSIVVSESNVKGLGVISYRTIDKEAAQSLDYIEGES